MPFKQRDLAYSPPMRGDEKALAVHKANIDVSVYPLAPQEIEPKLLPEVDLLAARIYQASFSRTTHTTSDPSIYKLLEILSIRRPRAFFLILNAFSSKNEQFQAFMAEILKLGYQYTLRVIDVTQATGLPVKERTVCMVGTLQSEDKLFEFPEYNSPIQILPEQCLQLNQPVDPWYFHVKSDKISQHERWAPFYCWKNNTYVEADRVQWNYIKIPLVKAGNAFRKITHREIATLKGFPVNYTLFDDMSKQWLYQKLMYAGNVLVIKQIAGTLNYILADNPFRSQQAERGMHLEILFRRYLSSLVDGGTIERSLSRKARVVDFAVRLEETNLYFEVKYYNSTISLPSKVRAVCKQLSSLASDGMPILVVANEVADSVKSECWKQFHVSIWDVGNLLWLFDELSDIRNDFVAWLDYSTEHVEIKPPFPNVFQKTPDGNYYFTDGSRRPRLAGGEGKPT